MKKIFSVLSVLIILAFNAKAQNIGINNTNPKVAVDINGGLATRTKVATPSGNAVNIPSNASFVIVSGGAATGTISCLYPSPYIDGQRMVIYNSNSGGYDLDFLGTKIPLNQGREFICSTLSGWVLLSGALGTEGWGLRGNAGTDTSINFIGTKDEQPLKFKVNNEYAGIIDRNNGNTAIGYLSLKSNDGTSNAAFGYHALQNNKGYGNVAMGTNAIEVDSFGTFNTALGFGAMNYRAGGTKNTAVGTSALTINRGNENVALGASTMPNDTSGKYNVVIGASASLLSTNSNGTVVIGHKALYNDTAAVGIVAIGRAALYNNISNTNNLAIGDSALFNNGIGAVQAFGHALNNMAIGPKSLLNNTTGSGNIAIGNNCLIKNNTGKENIAIGSNALASNIDGRANMAIGEDALRKITSGQGNIAVGAFSLQKCTAGLSNLGLGAFTLPNVEAGYFNIAMGNYGLENLNNGESNIAIGFRSLQYLTIGKGNIGVGDGSALFTKGNYNTIISNQSSTGRAYSGFDSSSENVIVGTTNRGFFNQSSRNTFLGNNIADAQLASANANVGVGDSAMFRLANGNFNVAIGALSGGNNYNGNGNTFIGYKSGLAAIGSNKLYIENSAADSLNALIYGDFAADSLLLNAKTVVKNNAVVRGFTKLGGYGTDVPSIKMKKLTGVNGAAGTTTPFLHGLTQSKILSVSILINASTSNDIPPRSTYVGFEYDYYVSPTNIFIRNITGNDASIVNRPVRILITYEE